MIIPPSLLYDSFSPHMVRSWGTTMKSLVLDDTSYEPVGFEQFQLSTAASYRQRFHLSCLAPACLSRYGFSVAFTECWWPHSIKWPLTTQQFTTLWWIKWSTAFCLSQHCIHTHIKTPCRCPIRSALSSDLVWCGQNRCFQSPKLLRLTFSFVSGWSTLHQQNN